jgi:hypothetical protein
MTFDLAKILQSKREYRQRLSALPIEEKLAMLDVLRERALTLRPPAPRPLITALECSSFPPTNSDKPHG